MRSFFHPQRRGGGATWIALILFVCKFVLSQTAAVQARSTPLLLPSAIAYDSAGDLYLAETGRHIVRKVDPAGNITSFAGNGTQGFAGDNSPAIGARLDSPQGLAVDAGGNVFIADTRNNRIRRVDAVTGNISTVAGNGTGAFAGDGGAATAASLDLPRAICLDPAGTSLYIADTVNNRVRRVTLSTAAINTVAGNGTQGFSGDGAPATSASIDSPDSVSIDPSGNLYIADTHNQRIRKVEASTGIITTLAGSGSLGKASPGGAAASSPLALPRGVTSDAQGNIYIAEAGNHRILRLDGTSGVLTVVAGSAEQAFAGDGGTAVAADLDSPRAVVLSSAGLVTVADTGNARVRQLLSTSSTGALIQTIAGLAPSAPGVLSLSAPSTAQYGSGTLTAFFSTGPPASGQITLVDVGDQPNTVIGTAVLSANSAIFSLSTLSAGQHHLQVTYPGDATHAPAQTPAALLLVTPAPLAVNIASATMPYGSPQPALTGTLAGLLPQDAAKVAVSFTTAATSASPVGSYPIVASLNGASAANYVLQSPTANLLITPATSVTLLRDAAAAGSFSGVLTAQVTSGTTGTPSGAVSLLDNGAVVQMAALDSTGSTTFSLLTLAAGSHVLSASYSGDGNFLPSASSPLTQTVASPPSADFTIAATQPSSQTLISGGSASYSLSVQMTGAGLSSPVTLSVSGLPAFTTASFSPSYLPPGANGSTPVVLTVKSLSSAASVKPSRSPNPTAALLALSLPLFGLSLHRAKFRRIRSAPALFLAFTAIAVSLTCTGCGDRTNSSAQSSPALQSYTLTVTGTSTGNNGAPLLRTATLTLMSSSTN